MFVFVTVQFMTSSEELDKDLHYKTCHTLIIQFMRVEHWFVLKHLNTQDNHQSDFGLDFVCRKSTILYSIFSFYLKFIFMFLFI